MAIQASSLEHLYNQGILNYVPYELCQPTPMSQMQQMPQMGMGYGNQYGQLVQTYGNPNNAPFVQQYSSPYLQQAQQGSLYNTYTTDSFVPRNLAPQENQYSVKQDVLDIGSDVGSKSDLKSQILHTENKNFRQSILEEANNTNNDVAKKRNSISKTALYKGFAAAGIIATTLVLILKGKKACSGSSSIWSKLNPKNWF